MLKIAIPMNIGKRHQPDGRLEYRFTYSRTGAGWPIDADLGLISSGKVFVPIEQGNLLNLGDLVGERGFEPPTPWSRIQGPT
jgi:hypothetical protein